MKKILYFVSLLLLAGIVVVACKKDDDSTLPGANHTVTGFTPASGSIGTLVTVSGTNFTNQNISVNFNGVDATVSSVNISGKSLMVFVPEDAETGKISVTIDDVEVKSAANFTVTNEVTGPDAIELATQAMEMHTLDVAEFPEITNSDEFPAGSSIQIESNNPDIVDINGDGDLVALQAGGAEIEVTIAYENVELSATVNVDVEESIIVVGEKSSNATIWINDNLVNLGEDYLESSANSVHGNGSKTFVGGQIEEEGKDNIAAVWEFQPTGSFNLIKLTDGEVHAEVHAIVDTGQEVLAVGYTDDIAYTAVLWTISGNGAISTIPLGDGLADSEAFEAAVGPNGHKYVVGYQEDGETGYEIATLWDIDAQGEVTAITLIEDLENADDSYANSVVVDQGEVHIVGMEYFSNYVGVYWNLNEGQLNKTVITSLGMKGRLYTISSYNNNILMAGEDGDEAVLWINNDPKTISNIGDPVILELFSTQSGTYMIGRKKCECPDNGAELWIMDNQGNIVTGELEKGSSRFYDILVK